MKYLLLFSALWFSFGGYAQAWTKEYDNVDECTCGLALVTKGDKHGFVTKEGKLVIPLIYQDALHYTEGMAAVKKDGKWGYLDSTGKEVIGCKYAYANSFSDGIAKVMKDRKWMAIDRNGKEVEE